MIHTEHLRKADENYEIYHDNNGNALHVHSKDGCSIIFRSIDDLIQYVYFGAQKERIYSDEELIQKAVDSVGYSFDEVQRFHNQEISKKFQKANNCGKKYE